MTKYQPGDDVIVDFDGMEHKGEVLEHRRGDVLCTITVDASADYGSIGPRMSPRSIVCVPEKRVRCFY